MKHETKVALGYAGLATGLVGLGAALGVIATRRRERPTLMGRREPEALAYRASRNIPNLIVIAPPQGSISTTTSQEILSTLRRMPRGPLGIAIHALGGVTIAVDHVAHALAKWPDRVTAYVPYRAMSGGTLIALAANEIVMDSSAILGPVDPQLYGLPAVTLAGMAEKKPLDKMKEEWIVFADEARKALAETRALVASMVRSPAAIQRLVGGDTTHGHPIKYGEAKQLGLPVSEGVPAEIRSVVDYEIERNRHVGPVFFIGGNRHTRIG
ncbi:MAG: hypothetical protein KC468_31570 [Myxococcales bacterium]|nr:hypothetical protein [Myxococcales bacterium]